MTHNPRLNAQDRRNLERMLEDLGDWPENKKKRQFIANRLKADDEAQARDVAKGRHVRSR